MSSKKSTSMLEGVIKTIFDIFWKVAGIIFTKVKDFTWEKSFALSGFLLEVYEKKSSKTLQPLEKKAAKTTLSGIIFIITIILLLFIIGIIL